MLVFGGAGQIGPARHGAASAHVRGVFAAPGPQEQS
jgi:hypothetical protein